MKYAPFTEREILRELAQPLELHTRDIMQYQLDFLHNFPFDRVREANSRGRAAAAGAPEDDAIKRQAQEEIASPRTARFIGMLALFLYRFHMCERCRQPADDAKLGALMTAVQQYFTALRRRMMSKRRLLMIVLPALLLSVRMSIEALFRHAYKKWWTTIDGREALKEMDAMIEQMLDPNQYHSHIAPLESSTEAIKIAARQELGVKPRGDREAKFFQTSVAISTALPRAPIVMHARNLAGETAIHSQLSRLASTDVRKTLFQSARSRPSPEQATASAARLVEGMIARPAVGSRKNTPGGR
jgi:cell division protein FtsB